MAYLFSSLMVGALLAGTALFSTHMGPLTASASEKANVSASTQTGIAADLDHVLGGLGFSGENASSDKADIKSGSQSDTNTDTESNDDGNVSDGEHADIESSTTINASSGHTDKGDETAITGGVDENDNQTLDL